ncbi:MAG: glycosyltransferase family 39 protein [Planctomycetes bacterium]|nr:glycosyltransferase family 39 protein [Planctomycetota bacterium]
MHPQRKGVGAPRGWWLAVAALIALAATLRWLRLGEWSYWSDEAFTLSDAHAFVAGTAETGGPEHKLSFAVYGLYFEWLRSMGVFVDEFVARSLPAAFGVLGVAATILLGARAAGHPGALFAGLLVAVSPFHLYWSQNARSYAMEIVMAIPAGLLLGRAILSGSRSVLVAGIALLGAAAFAHPTALALVPPILVFAAVARGVDSASPVRRNVWLWLLVAAALAAVLTLSPLGLAVWKHFRNKSGASPALFVTTVAYYFRPTLLAAAAICAFRGWRRRDLDSQFLALLGFGTLASGLAASLVVRVNAQYVVAALPFLALLVGRELAMLVWSHGAGLKTAAAGFALTLLADFSAGAFLYFGPEHGHRAHWREACEFVWKRREPGDLVAATQATIVECYLNPGNLEPRDVRSALYLGKYLPEKFESLPTLSRRVWILVLDVDLDEWPSDVRTRFRSFLRDECKAAAEWPLQISGKDQTLRVWRYDP